MGSRRSVIGQLYRPTSAVAAVAVKRARVAETALGGAAAGALARAAAAAAGTPQEVGANPLSGSVTVLHGANSRCARSQQTPRTALR